MQTLERNGYTAEQVRAALQGLYGTRRMEFRYELLDNNNNSIRTLENVLSGSITQDAEASIKRTAKFSIRDDGTIDFLRERIRPWARLYMPVTPASGLQTTFTYDDVVEDSVKSILARWRFDEAAGATVAEDATGNSHSADYGAGVVVQSPALIEDDGRSAYLSTTETDSQIEVTGAGFLNGNNTMSFSGWFKLDELVTDGTLFVTTVSSTWGSFDGEWDDLLLQEWDDYGGAVGGVTVDLLSATKNIRVTIYLNGQEVVASTPSNTITTEKVFFAFTWTSGGMVHLYLNGELVTSVQSTVIGTIDGIESLIIGGGTIDGFVDDFLFTSGVMTDTSIRNLYLTGANIGPGSPTSGTYVEWPLGVFLLSTPNREADASGVVIRSVEAYDQGMILDSQLTAEPYYVAGGETYTDAIAELLSNTTGLGEFSVVPSSTTLPAQRMWDAGASHLTILNDLTTAVNYEPIHFDENGIAIVQPYVSPQDRVSEYTYAADAVSVLIPGASQNLDLFSQPNQWVLVVSEPDRPVLSAVYTNDDPTSPTSTVNRGRIITDFRTEQEAATQTLLNEKVQIIAQEATQIFEEVKFSTAIMPIHNHRDVYWLSYPQLSIEANYFELSWSYNLQAGAGMEHTARRVVVLNGSLT